MEEIDQNLIEQYLANELSEAERTEVDQRRKGDPLFDQAILDAEMAREGLRVYLREQLRQRLRERDRILDAENGDSNDTRPFKLWWVLVAAMLLISLLVWKFLISSDHPAAPVISNGQDSIEMEELAREDSIISNKAEERKLPEQEKEKRREESAQKKSEEIFADNFEPYKDDSMSPISKGENEDKPLTNFRKFYWEGKYPDAVQAYSSLTVDDQKNDNIRFVYAIALMAGQRTEEAQTLLKNIVDRKRSIYLGEAYWYLGLTYLKQGDLDLTRKYIQQCVDEADESPIRMKARELVKTLK